MPSSTVPSSLMRILLRRLSRVRSSRCSVFAPKQVRVVTVGAFKRMGKHNGKVATVLCFRILFWIAAQQRHTTPQQPVSANQSELEKSRFAERERTKGNEHFRAHEYDRAIEVKALLADCAWLCAMPHVCDWGFFSCQCYERSAGAFPSAEAFGNIAACHLQQFDDDVKQHPAQSASLQLSAEADRHLAAALAASERSLEINPQFVKAWIRRGMVFLHRSDFARAEQGALQRFFFFFLRFLTVRPVSEFLHALQLSPQNAEVSKLLERARQSAAVAQQQQQQQPRQPRAPIPSARLETKQPPSSIAPPSRPTKARTCLPALPLSFSFLMRFASSVFHRRD